MGLAGKKSSLEANRYFWKNGAERSASRQIAGLADRGVGEKPVRTLNQYWGHGRVFWRSGR